MTANQGVNADASQLRVLRTGYTRRISGENMTELFDFQTRWEKIVDKALSNGYDSLLPNEKIWLNVQYLTNSIGDGGLISYYYNSPADTLDDCLNALEVVGATKMKSLMERMNILFPEGVPKDITARNEVISSWPDDDEKLEQLLDEIEETASSEKRKVEDKLVLFIQKTGLAN